jgi:hypothetical protein
VVITDSGRACINDVGIYTAVMQATQGDRVFVPPEWPYKSPDELVDGICTLHTDVYSFGCTVYAVGGIISDCAPFLMLPRVRYIRGNVLSNVCLLVAYNSSLSRGMGLF